MLSEWITTKWKSIDCWRRRWFLTFAWTVSNYTIQQQLIENKKQTVYVTSVLEDENILISANEKIITDLFLTFPYSTINMRRKLSYAVRKLNVYNFNHTGMKFWINLCIISGYMLWFSRIKIMLTLKKSSMIYFFSRKIWWLLMFTVNLILLKYLIQLRTYSIIN